MPDTPPGDGRPDFADDLAGATLPAGGSPRVSSSLTAPVVERDGEPVRRWCPCCGALAEHPPWLCPLYDPEGGVATGCMGLWIWGTLAFFWLPAGAVVALYLLA